MSGGIRVEGSAVVLMFDPDRKRDNRNTASNDNQGADENKTVTVRRAAEAGGEPVKIKVPVKEFFGVSVSTSISEDGVLTSAIELVHTDPELTYRVYEETGNTNVVAEWQNWGQKLRLPLYIRTGDGSLMPYSQQVDGVAVGDSHTRRKLAVDAARRPRFLNRRKPG